jgi:hypothetical protein
MNRSLPILILLLLAAALAAVPRDMCIVEIGTGTWCQYCPGAAMGADDLVSNHHRAAIVEYHNGDNYANTYSDARNTYYNLTGFPTANFDGTNPSVGGSHTASMYTGYRTKVNARLAVPSAYTITATGTHISNTYNVTVTVTKVETDTNTNLKLHGVMTESGIQYAWQGQTHLEFVERLMSPDQNGTTIDFSSGNTQTVNLTFTALPAWNASELEFIFFLQNNTSHEILQGCKYSVQALENTSPLDFASIDFGNVSQDGVYVETFTLHNWWSQDMNIDVTSNSPDYFILEHVRDAYVIPFMEDKVFDVMFLPSTSGASNGVITITTDNPAYPELSINLSANVIPTVNEDNTQILVSDRITTIAPNPFSETAVIRYSLKASETASLNIYNVKGAKVWSAPVNSRQDGTGNQTWTGKDSQGNISPAGVYFCTLVVAGKTVSTQKLIKLN